MIKNTILKIKTYITGYRPLDTVVARIDKKTNHIVISRFLMVKNGKYIVVNLSTGRKEKADLILKVSEDQALNIIKYANTIFTK